MELSEVMVLSPCFYPTTRPAWRLEKSAKVFGVPLTFYGVGEPYVNWIDTHVVRLRQVLEASGKPYFFFCDAIDTFFLRDWADTVALFDGGDSLLCGWEPGDELNAGLFMGDTGVMVQALKEIGDKLWGDSGDPQVRWNALFKGVGDAWRIKLDSGCRVFQTTSRGQLIEPTVLDDRRVFNRRTKTFPCLLHACGGYVDPHIFKSEAMGYWWDMANMEDVC